MFNEGFVVFLEYCKKHQFDFPVYVAYFKSDEKMCIIDRPFTINELLDLKLTRSELASKLKDRCNEIGRKSIEELS